MPHWQLAALRFVLPQGPLLERTLNALPFPGAVTGLEQSPLLSKMSSVVSTGSGSFLSRIPAPLGDGHICCHGDKAAQASACMEHLGDSRLGVHAVLPGPFTPSLHGRPYQPHFAGEAAEARGGAILRNVELSEILCGQVLSSSGWDPQLSL